MRILLVNDDGIDEEGLAAAAEALSAHETLVVAPAEHCSGSGQSLGLYGSLTVQQRGPGRWAVDGTPTDCVKLALTSLMEAPPDLVVSGINPGANMANNVFYSGTVAAATEAAMWGIPAMAVSVESGGGRPRFETASSVATRLVESGISSMLPSRTVLNVNVPDRPAEDIAGYAWTHTARFAADIPFEELERGRVFRYGRFRTQAVEEEEGTDVQAVGRGLVSLTPLSTDRSHLRDLPGLEVLNGGAV